MIIEILKVIFVLINLTGIMLFIRIIKEYESRYYTEIKNNKELEKRLNFEIENNDKLKILYRNLKKDYRNQQQNREKL